MTQRTAQNIQTAIKR